jgi:hypothetical protein
MDVRIIKARFCDLLAEQILLYQEAGRTILGSISMANLQMRSVEWMGMIEKIYRKAKISQAK